MTGLVGAVACQEVVGTSRSLSPWLSNLARQRSRTVVNALPTPDISLTVFSLISKFEGAKGAVEFWKNSHPVTAFPPKTTVLLHVVKENYNPHVSQFAPSITFGPEHIAEIGAPPREYVMKKYGASFFDE